MSELLRGLKGDDAISHNTKVTAKGAHGNKAECFFFAPLFFEKWP